MAYCSKCGVKLEENVEYCPLCQYKVPEDLIAKDERKQSFPVTVNAFERQKDVTRNMVFYTYFMISLATITIFMILNTMSERWNRFFEYGIVIVIASIILVFLMLGYIKKVERIVLGLGVTVLFIALMLDGMDGHLSWFITYALPINVVSTTVFIFISKRYSKSAYKNHFIFVPVFICMALAIILPFVELTLSINILGRVRLSWSLISSVSLLAFSGIVAGLYYKMPAYIKERLIRLFHV